jgi:hypothetical protein
VDQNSGGELYGARALMKELGLAEQPRRGVSGERRRSRKQNRSAPQPGDRLISDPDGSDPRDSLTPGQRRVVVRLARGEDLKATAIREGVHPERVRRWLGAQRFARALMREIAQPTEFRLADELRALAHISGRAKGESHAE